jgi:hypothetical protein
MAGHKVVEISDSDSNPEKIYRITDQDEELRSHQKSKLVQLFNQIKENRMNRNRSRRKSGKRVSYT